MATIRQIGPVRHHRLQNVIGSCAFQDLGFVGQLGEGAGASTAITHI
jgi:hypothetical protein